MVKMNQTQKTAKVPLTNIHFAAKSQALMVVSFTARMILSVLGYLLKLVQLMLPLGFYMFFMQMRTTGQVVTILDRFVDPNSQWMYIYDGAVIVNTNPGELRRKHRKFSNWVEYNTTNIKIGIMAVIAVTLILMYIKLG